jgi:5-(carboxyamino)imidazole ribonucleotide mutase
VSTAGLHPIVAVVMGSDSDLRVMQAAVEVLTEFGVSHTVRVVSAHRTPDDMLAFGHNAADAGLRVIIAGAGGAAHLPGMLASVTSLPVIGVPVNITALAGTDALLSIAQMPRGVPVATMAIDGAANAALLAVRILASATDELAAILRQQLGAHRATLADTARAADRNLVHRSGS